MITKVREHDESNFKISVFLEELYGILEKAHTETGHDGRDRMIKHLNNGYGNISRYCIELFLSYVKTAISKRSTSQNGVSRSSHKVL